MRKNQTPIIEFFSLFKKKIVSILIIFCVSIMGSYYYNNSIKYTKYQYSLTFDVVSEWNTSQLNLNYKDVLSLTKSSILNLIKDFNPSNYTLELSGKYILNFEVDSPVIIVDFINNLNLKINESIKDVLIQKVQILKRKDILNKKTITKKIAILESERQDLKNKINIANKDKKDQIKYEIEIDAILINSNLKSLKLEKQLMNDQFKSLLDVDLSMSLDPEQKSKIETIISLKTDYVKLRKLIMIEEQKLKLIKIKEKKILNNKKELNKYNEFDKYQLNKIHQDLLFLNDELLSNTINDEFFLLSNNYNNFSAEPTLTFYGISDWTVTNNKSSTKEIIGAGIFFGLLLNLFFLFIVSDYLRKSLEN